MKLFIFLMTLPSLLLGFVDLEKTHDPFVLETRKIEIPGYPDAFNPSIVEWQGVYLLSFRFREPLVKSGNQKALGGPFVKSANQVGLVFLDQNFNLASDPYILEIPFRFKDLESQSQDPRLIVISDTLYMVYNNVGEVDIKGIRRMITSKITFDGDRFHVSILDSLLNFENQNPGKHEKSWVPFDYQGELLLSYSINPHLVFKPSGNHDCKSIATSEALFNWTFGDLRGGTPAALSDGEYLAFFHSGIDMASEQSKGKKMTHYFMGAYTFSSAPPFELTKVSKKPIIGKNFYNGPIYDTWKPLRVVFPAGIIVKDSFVYVVYGRQDHEVWVVKMDKKGLLESLDFVVPGER